MKFEFNYKGREFNLEVKECRNSFSKMMGLMFRKRSRPLLFIFSKPLNQKIHSFFCQPFFAIWFSGDEIVDAELVKSWRFSVKSKNKFDKLLEIPSSDENFCFFVDERKI